MRRGKREVIQVSCLGSTTGEFAILDIGFLKKPELVDIGLMKKPELAKLFTQLVKTDCIQASGIQVSVVPGARFSLKHQRIEQDGLCLHRIYFAVDTSCLYQACSV